MRLTVRTGPDAGTSVDVAGREILIGRDEECDFVLRDDTVSGRHASLRVLVEGAAVLTDLESRNGTFVDGRRILEPVTLQGGERLRFGDVVVSVGEAPRGGETIAAELGAWLTIDSGRELGTTIKVTGEHFVIGRDESCSLVLRDAKVSREHAAIRVVGLSRAVITDLGSSNGTFVDGNRIDAPVELRGDETLRIGDTSLRFGEVAIEPPAVHDRTGVFTAATVRRDMIRGEAGAGAVEPVAAATERRRRLTLVATILGSSLAFIDATVVIVALPAIGQDLDLGLAGQQWVFLSYSLTLAALYLLGGGVGDRYGRRTTFAAATVGFALASVLAGAAPTGAVLIVGRALQGVAGAFLSTNSLALLRSVYGAESGRAIGLWTAFTGIAAMLGPPAGGALVEWASWRWIFYVNVPVAAATIVFARLGRCPEVTRVRAGCLDVPGAVLAATAFGALTFGLVEGADKGFGSLWWSFALAGAALAGLVVAERYAADPMLPPHLFRRRNFAVANLESFLVYAVEYGGLLFFIAYLQFLGFTAFEAGLLTLPGSLIVAALAARFGSLADRHGPRFFLSAGPMLMGAGLLFFALLEERSDVWTVGIAGLTLFSVGLSAIVAPMTTTALRAAPEAYAGIASGINSTATRMGSLFAVASIGLAISVVFENRAGDASAEPLERGQSAPQLREASSDAFQAGMLVAATLAFAGAAVGAAGISNAEARTEAAGEQAVATEPVAES